MGIDDTVVQQLGDMENKDGQLATESKNNSTERDVENEVGDYMMAASHSQIISAEIREIGEELKQESGDLDKNVDGITNSINSKAESLDLAAGNAQTFAGKFKAAFTLQESRNRWAQRWAKSN